jgi:hypothetical protein
MRFLALLVLAAAAPLAGCVSTDTSIFVVPTISLPTAAVSMVTLGTELEGTFTLDLHLGPRAAGPSDVSLGEFSILDSTMTTTIVPTLTVTSSPPFPQTVQPESDAISGFTFSTGTSLLKADVETQLCMPGGVVIQGTIEDSLAGKGTPASSPVFTVTGCP